MNSVSYIIPMCNMGNKDYKDRVDTLNFSFKYFFPKQTGICLEVVLVEQKVADRQTLMERLVIPESVVVQQIIIEYPTFNKSWCCNVGVKKASYNNIILGESDMYVDDPQYLQKFIDHANTQQLKWCFGWNQLAFVKKMQKADILKRGGLKDGEEYHVRHREEKYGFEGGVVFWERGFYYEIGGMNEFFEGLGGMDNEMSSRSECASGKYPYFNATVYHFDHAESPLKRCPSRLKNARMMQFVRLHPQKAIDMLKGNRIGYIDYPIVKKTTDFSDMAMSMNFRLGANYRSQGFYEAKKDAIKYFQTQKTNTPKAKAIKELQEHKKVITPVSQPHTHGGIIIAGPYGGEFGWELMTWQAHLRHLKRTCDKLIVVCNPEKSYLYEDFATFIVPFKTSGKPDMFRNETEHPEKLPMAKLEEITGGGYLHLQPGPAICTNKVPQDFIRYGKKMDSPFDVLIHARADQREVVEDRNWSEASWKELIEMLESAGYSGNRIGCIGTKGASGHYPHTMDLRDKPLKDVADYLKNAKICIGTSSGPMHFASLCGCPHVVWSTNRLWKVGWQKGTNRQRYEKMWNPFQTPVHFIDHEGWHPKPDIVFQGILDLLEKTK